MFKEIKDTNLIYELWKSYGQDLDIPYKSNIKAHLKRFSFFGFYINNHLAGLCTYKLTNSEVFIDSIITLPEFEAQDITTKLILFIYVKTKSLIKTLNYKYKITVKLGLPNNLLFQSLSIKQELSTTRSGKTDLVTYLFNTDLLDQKLQEYNS